MPIDPSQTATQTIQDAPANLQPQAFKSPKDPSQDSPFGPAYVLDPSHQSSAAPVSAGTVPFVATTAGQTLASLPSLKPLGTASLTELSLQHLLDPSGGKPSFGQR